ncbi:YidC/Oxa1 family membrane protein insertase [Ruminococcus sp. YE71]|uniref:YidC/Oxa1 family membrane protein insertase n=1 Tax=unclassified Ruminococcus TaxID=2608920 RepID=UPI00088A5ED1|nr:MULTISPECIES: membrane protein insertase YidC [unclassified Ruminococcus]SDA14564.1 YidC/Oxa1 family membrane protein insertase [Ruminococcus sp. YE78]SFW21198.1 YidC/Oxa1 family membrane protein insertase [Ruminococcus sp. YE71]
MGILATPLGWLMKGLYMLVKNYGIALLLFTVVTRLITLPVNIKQQKSTQRMAMLQPELEKIKQKYGKNQEKVNEETMKLYSENNVNPMASCLPMLVPLILLYAMIPVVYQPLTYISNADKANVKSDAVYVKNVYTISAEIEDSASSVEKLLDGVAEDERAEKLGEILSDKEKYKNSAKALSSMTEDEKDRILNDLATYEGLDTFIIDSDNFTSNLMKSSYGPEALLFNFETKADGRYIGVLHGDVQEAIQDLDYTAFGLNLGKIPTKKDATVFIPIISFVFQLISMVIGQVFQRRNNPETKMQPGVLMTLFMMPLLSLWIGFKFPCGLGLYWVYSSVWAAFQVLFLNLVYTPDKIKELAAKDAEKAKAKRKKKGPSFMERALEVRNEQGSTPPSVKDAKKKYSEFDDEDDDDEDDKKLSKSQRRDRDRQKLNEARKRYAEKYGDEYNED